LRKRSVTCRRVSTRLADVPPLTASSSSAMIECAGCCTIVGSLSVVERLARTMTSRTYTCVKGRNRWKYRSAAPEAGNSLAAVVASTPASKHAAHCERRVSNCFTNVIGTYAAISRDKSPMSNHIMHAPPLPVSRSGCYPLQAVPWISRIAMCRTRRRQGWPLPRRKLTKPTLKYSFTTNFIKPPMRSMTEARAREFEGLGHQ